ALRTAEADVAAHFRQADAAEELAFGRPHRHAAVADRTARIARDPEIAVHVAADAVRAALHAIDHAVGKQFLVRQLVVGADIEHMDVALAAGAGVARA